MLPIERIVDVNVSAATRPITTASFSNALFIAKHNVFTERARVYSSSTAAINDGFDTNSPVVQFLQGAFGGNQSPDTVIIGRSVLTDIDLTVGAVAEGDIFSLTVKVGNTTTAISYTALALDDANAVATALQGLITAVSGVTATVATNVVTVTPDDINTELALYDITENLTASYNGTEDYDVAYAAIAAEITVDAFFLAGDTRTEADVQDLFDIAAANELFVVTSSSDVNTYSAVSTSDIAYVLSNNSYENGLGFYSADAATSYRPEGALIGEWAATNPGTVTLSGVDLVGVSADNLTETQAAALDAKNFNYYTPTTGGNNWFWNGVVPTGDFADLIRFKLWLTARVRESVYGLLKRKNATTNSKVPYNQAGKNMIRGAIAEVLEQAYQRGATSIDADGKRYQIFFPAVDNSNDKANRILRDVEFSVVYSNAIHTVIINGYITL